MKVDNNRIQFLSTINRILVFVFITISLLFLSVQHIPVSKQPEKGIFSNRARPLVIAHRGGAGIAPENTIYAFKLAERIGVDAIELDVRITKDKQLVVIHDETIDRTTNGTGMVSDYTLEELKKFDAGYHLKLENQGYPFRNKGITIPSLEEVFQHIKNTPFVIELKDPNPRIEKQVAALIKKYELKKKVIVGSFNDASLKRFASRTDGKIQIGTGVKTIKYFVLLHKLRLDRLYPLNRSAVQIPIKAGGVDLATERLIKTVRERNIAIHYWTINDEKTMKQLIELNVDGIITDYPNLLLRLVDQSTKEI